MGDIFMIAHRADHIGGGPKQCTSVLFVFYLCQRRRVAFLRSRPGRHVSSRRHLCRSHFTRREAGLRTPLVRFMPRSLPTQRAAGKTLSDFPRGLAGPTKRGDRPRADALASDRGSGRRPASSGACGRLAFRHLGSHD
jgi:hypothetical protein